MKISKNTLLLGGAVGLGLLCFFGANYYLKSTLSREEARLAGEYTTTKVIVAKLDIPAGGVISEENLAVRTIPERYVSSSALPPEELEMVSGQRVMVALKPGDPVDRGALERADHAALSTTVAKGERAITFPVDEISSMSGMLVPGDIIDLLYSGPGTTANSYRQPAVDGKVEPKELLHVRAIMQAVSVMATGKTTQKRVVQTEEGEPREVDVNFSTVTLNVTPEQAEQILMAQKIGQLTAVLRHPDDKTRLSRKALDEQTFRQVDPAPPVRRAGGVNGGRYVETIIGGNGQAGGTRMLTPEGEAMAVLLKGMTPAAGPAPAAAPAPSAGDVRSRLGITPPPAPAKTSQSPVSPTKS